MDERHFSKRDALENSDVSNTKSAYTGSSFMNGPPLWPNFQPRPVLRYKQMAFQ